MNFPLTDQLDYERGAICDRCERPFNLGEPYATVLEGMISDSPVGVAICLPCATTFVEADSEREEPS